MRGNDLKLLRENVADQVLRIGLLGCGAIAQFAHLPALARTKRVQLVALCDAADDLLQAIGCRTAINRRYTQYDDMLRDDRVQAVLIAVPDPWHVPLAAQALRVGKHVLVEKPLGANSTECQELAHLVGDTGLVLQVGSMKRHDPGVAFAKAFIRERMGNILSVSGVYRDSLFRTAMQESCLDRLITSVRIAKPTIDPKGDRQHYNLFTQGSHLFDNLRYLAGNVLAVSAQFAQSAGQMTWHGLLEFATGGRGHFELTCKACGDWREEYAVLGEQGSVDVQVGLPFYHRPAQVRAFDGRSQQWSQPLGGNSNAYVNQLEAFAATIFEGLPATPDVHDGLAVVRLLEAVEQSAVLGVRVGVPQEEES